MTAHFVRMTSPAASMTPLRGTADRSVIERPRREVI